MLHHFLGSPGAGAGAVQADSSSIDIIDFKDQFALDKLIRYHENMYLLLHKSQIVGRFNNHIIFKVEKCNRIFQMGGEAVIDKTSITRQTISASLQDWLENILAFHLIKQRTFSDKWSVFMPVNHLQHHWTSLFGSFKLSVEAISFLETMQAAFDESTFAKHLSKLEIDYATEINPVKNFVQSYLVLHGPIPFEHVRIKHQDSMNDSKYHESVMLSAGTFMEQFNESSSFKAIESVQQAGNTCCEHTVANGMAKGLYGHTLTVFDSTEARQLTNLLSKMKPGDDELAFEVHRLFKEVNPYTHEVSSKAKSRLKA